uniref:Uncharacterized protein n=1 Tax=Human herpesvirus 2 TaxID=10310 RepID=A0A481T4M9_HHV2|nr:hypothetical protein [Human alphaherpesvirus 2]QBH83737.1 hypothetical protein [Human alphaherpesvirus 2]
MSAGPPARCVCQTKNKRPTRKLLCLSVWFFWGWRKERQKKKQTRHRSYV